MSSNCTHNCNTCSTECSSKEEKKSRYLQPKDTTSIKKIYGIVSGKGGVGKSLVTSLMALSSANKGYKTGIMDADITGPSIPKSFGINGKAKGSEAGLIPEVSKKGIKVMSTNLLLPNDTDPVIWRGPVISGMVSQFYTDVLWEDLDVLYIDMPPGTGDVALTVFQSIPIDGIIIVTSPQELVSMIVEKAVKMAEKMNIPIVGIVENMSYFICPDCNNRHYIFGQSDIEQLASQYGISNTVRLAIDSQIANYCDKGNIEDYNGDNLLQLSNLLNKLM